MKRLIFVFVIIVMTVIVFTSCGHEHSYGEWKIKTDSSCALEGEKIRECECGEIETEKIKKKSHNVTAISEVLPTCENYGYTKGTYCRDCGSYIEEPMPISPSHNYVPTVISDPTCTANGANLYTCSECDATYTEVLEALGHNFESATCTSPKACTVCRYTDGEPLGHTLQVGICERCNEFVQPSVLLPEFPVTAAVEITGYKTQINITDISYRFTENSVIFTYSGVKTLDEGELTDGRYLCGFSYKLYTVDGVLISSGRSAILDLSVGDRFHNKTIFIDGLSNLSDSYVLIIEDYRQQ